MSLIHALVAHGNTILVESSVGKRNFSQAVQTILSKIPPNNSKLTYVWEQYLFHYVSEGGFTYLVMAEDAAGRHLVPDAPEAQSYTNLTRKVHRAIAHASLRRSGFTGVYRLSYHDLQRRFEAFSPSSSSSNVAPSAHSYTGFHPQLASLLRQYNDNPPPDALHTAQQNLAQVKDIMVQNVEQILSRGERIELLVDKTDTMAGQAWAFRRGARQVRRQQFWRNQRIMILSIAVGILFFYIFIAQFCGYGLNCASKK